MPSLDETNFLHQRGDRKVFFYGWVVLTACAIIGLISYGTRFTFGVFFKSIEGDFGINRAATSGVTAACQIIGAIACFAGGWALDRYGVKKVLTVAGILVATSLLLTSRVNALWQLYITYGFLLALGTGTVNTSVMATVSRWFIRKRGLALSISTSAVSIGIMLAPMISLAIVSSGWQNAYLFIGLATIIFWLPSALLLKKPPDYTPIPASATNKTAEDKGKGFSLREAARMKPFWGCVFIYFSHSFCLLLVLTHIVPFAQDVGIDATGAAVALSIFGGSSLVGRLLIGRIIDVKRSTVAVLLICTLALCLSMLFLVWADRLWMLYLFAVVFGFGFGGTSPAIMALVAEIFGTRRLGSISGALDTFFSTGGAAGPALAGFIFDAQGSYTTAFLIAFALASISLWAVLALRKPAFAKRTLFKV